MESRVWHEAYDPEVSPEVHFRELTLRDFVANAAKNFGDRPALSFLNMVMTYGELSDKVDRLATALSRLGVEKNSRVAVQLPNTPQSVISFFAVQRLGAQAVMTNPLYVPREIEHQWIDAGCEHAIVADFIYDQKLRGIRHQLPVREYIIASVPEYLRFPLKQLAPLKLKRAKPPLVAKIEPGPGIHHFRPLVDGTPPSPPHVDIEMDDLALLQYTGGTTGVSKAAMLTQRNLSYNTQQIRQWFSAMKDGDEVLLAALPFFHIFGVTVVACLSSFIAAEMALVANPRDIASVVKTLAARKVTLLPAVPAMFGSINRFPDIEKKDLRSIRYSFSGSAPMPLDIQQEFERLTGTVLLEGYGLTETSPVATVNPIKGKRKIGTIGIPIPNTDVRLVDVETGTNDVALGEVGEVWIRGPQVMPGYWNRDDETAEAFGPDGWFKTGDLAVMDDEGYFRIVGRKKDMILASGYNIYPDEIDQVLSMHPDVLESCTIGVPDPRRGETVKAFIVLHPGRSLTAEEVTAYCRENLASYKIPRLIEFRDELPRSSVLKLLRRALRDEEIGKQDADREGKPTGGEPAR